LNKIWNNRVILELEEASLKHILGIDALNSEKVKHHVVGQMESRVDGVGLSHNEVASHLRGHLAVDHANHDSFVVQTTTPGSTRHLDVLSRSDLRTKSL